jgi:hypothetical protein
MAIGDPQKVINPGGHSYTASGTKAAKDRVVSETRKHNISKAAINRPDRLGVSKKDRAQIKSPKGGQPSSYQARSKGGYDPNKGSMKDKSPQGGAKKKAKKTSGAIKGRYNR